MQEILDENINTANLSKERTHLSLSCLGHETSDVYANFQYLLSLSCLGHETSDVYANFQYLLYLARKNQELGRSSRNSSRNSVPKLDRLVDQAVSIWLKHCCSVNFLFFGSHSAQFLSFSLGSAPTESLGSKLPLRPILRPALCGHHSTPPGLSVRGR